VCVCCTGNERSRNGARVYFPGPHSALPPTPFQCPQCPMTAWRFCALQVYFATRCDEAEPFVPTDYAALNPIGKTLAFTVDLSQVECGCNAAVYLTSMHSVTNPGWCYEPGGPHGGDYYCDANSGITCGNECAEIDLMEANKHAWHTMQHVGNGDAAGGVGIGGVGIKWAFGASEYGPGARLVHGERRRAPTAHTVHTRTNTYTCRPTAFSALMALHCACTRVRLPVCALFSLTALVHAGCVLLQANTAGCTSSSRRARVTST